MKQTAFAPVLIQFRAVTDEENAYQESDCQSRNRYGQATSPKLPLKHRVRAARRLPASPLLRVLELNRGLVRCRDAFSLSYTLFAVLTMSRHFDFFRCESGFARQRPLSQMPAPNVTSEKHLQRGSKRHSKERTDDSTNDQPPDKDRHNYCH